MTGISLRRVWRGYLCGGYGGEYICGGYVRDISAEGMAGISERGYGKDISAENLARIHVSLLVKGRDISAEVMTKISPRGFGKDISVHVRQGYFCGGEVWYISA